MLTFLSKHSFTCHWIQEVANSQINSAPCLYDRDQRCEVHIENDLPLDCDTQLTQAKSLLVLHYIFDYTVIDLDLQNYNIYKKSKKAGFYEQNMLVLDQNVVMFL